MFIFHSELLKLLSWIPQPLIFLDFLDWYLASKWHLPISSIGCCSIGQQKKYSFFFLSALHSPWLHFLGISKVEPEQSKVDASVENILSLKTLNERNITFSLWFLIDCLNFINKSFIELDSLSFEILSVLFFRISSDL